MTQPQTLIFDLGTSVFFGTEALDDAGMPADLLGVDVTCTAEHVKTGETKALELVWIDRAAGRFEFWGPGDALASGWLLGAWEARIVYTRPGGGAGGRPLALGTETMGLFIRKAP